MSNYVVLWNAEPFLKEKELNPQHLEPANLTTKTKEVLQWIPAPCVIQVTRLLIFLQKRKWSRTNRERNILREA